MTYNRDMACDYAHKWAYSRNPKYINFDSMGGDCTNFISQCLYAGCGVMNFTPTYGWYYKSLQKRSAAWSGVEFLYRFLTANHGPGPYGTIWPIDQAELGDVIQLCFDGKKFGHSLLVTAKDGRDILVATHTNDCLNQPISRWNAVGRRLIHIDGVR